MKAITAKSLGLILVLGAYSLCVGCTTKKDLTVWTAELPSPDGKWIASADTVQNGGFGSGYIATSVYLRRAGDSREPVTMLELSCQGPIAHPYTLDNSANAGGSIHLSMRWIDESHLRVTYDGHPEVLFQALKLGNVSFSADETSSTAPDVKS